MLMHVIVHRGCINTVRESAPIADSRRKMTLLHWGIKPVSVDLCLAFRFIARI